jgi:SAM-dependent methyltransferase
MQSDFNGEAGSDSNLNEGSAKLNFSDRVDALRVDFERKNLCQKWLQAEYQHLCDSDLPRFNARVLYLTPFQSDVSPAFPHSRQCLRVSHAHEGAGEDVALEAANLPFDSDAFDVVIVQHVLEFSENPQAVLKEAARVVKPNGKIVVYSINPMTIGSALAVFIRMFGKQGVWNRRTLMGFRLYDWLKFLDFKPLSTSYLGHALPFQLMPNSRLMQKLSRVLKGLNLPCSGVLGIVAEKHQLGMTPLDSPWASMAWKPQFYSIKPVHSAVSARTKSNL